MLTSKAEHLLCFIQFLCDKWEYNIETIRNSQFAEEGLKKKYIYEERNEAWWK